MNNKSQTPYSAINHIALMINPFSSMYDGVPGFGTVSRPPAPIIRPLSTEDKYRYNMVGWSEPPIGAGGLEVKTNMQQSLAIIASQKKVISVSGWCSGDEIDPEDLNMTSQFRRACWFLSNTESCKKTYTRSSSYGLKHSAERAFQKYHPRDDYYICNGIFILAAIYMGYAPEKLWKQKESDRSAINVYIRIKCNSIPTN